MEISGVSNQYYQIGTVCNITPAPKEKAEASSADSYFSQGAIHRKINPRQNILDIIDKGSMEEAEAIVRSHNRPHGGAILGPVINLREIMAAEGAGFTDIAPRIERVAEKFRVQSKRVHEQELEIIRKGSEEGKNAKVILSDMIDLYDKQSELFKLSIGWDGHMLSDQDQYSKLIELTPDYIDKYA